MTKQEFINSLKVISITKKGKTTILTTDTNKYVIKDTNKKLDFYEYLENRGFNYFPFVYKEINDNVEITDYIEEKEVPSEQKIEDLAYLASLLHLTTSFDKNIDTDSIKEIYENIIDKENYLLEYYQNLQNIIEEEIYMSPANYLLIRNISKIYYALDKSRNYLEKWYKSIINNKQIRYSYIHNSLEENHLLEANNFYLISWNNSKIDLPIIDIEHLYRNSYLKMNLSNILNIYERKYPLKKEEKYLLIALLLIPDKYKFEIEDEYSRIKQVSNIILYTDKMIEFLEYYSKESNNNTEKQE